MIVLCSSKPKTLSLIMTEKIYDIIDSYKIKDLKCDVLRFQLPISYTDNDEYSSKTIAVVATLCQKYDKSLNGLLPKKPKIIAYLQGGPGCPSRPPHTNMAYTKCLISRGYQVLYLDQRGTGLSTPLNAKSFPKLVPRHDHDTDREYVDKQLQFVLNFTGASIIEDLERIRIMLIGDLKWSIIGQSFGGFCSFIYLSKYPESLNESVITGGIPPINHGPDDVYSAGYKHAKERNAHYYDKYPHDVTHVNDILSYLSSNNVQLPNGGTLSVERFQMLGLVMGGHGGTDSLHQLVFNFINDLALFSEPSYATLLSIQSTLVFETNILYALFQESIYCDGNNPHVKSSYWSADRLRYAPGNENFIFDAKSNKPTYFTSEMVYKSMFDDYVELRDFKLLAEALHTNTHWPKLYDVDTLNTLSFDKVPVVGAIYVNDLYVDFTLSRKVIQDVFQGKNYRLYVTSEYFHNGVGVAPEKVLGTLFDLLTDEVD